MANEVEEIDEVIRDLNDDPHFELALASLPTYGVNKICGYTNGYGNTLWVRRTKTRPSENIDPFTRKTKIKAVATIIKKEQKAGLVRLHLYEFFEIRYSNKLCRIGLGTKELTIKEEEFNAEYKPSGYDLSDAVKVIRNATVLGLLPKDFLNQEIVDRLDDPT